MSYKKNEDFEGGPGGAVMDKMTVFQDCISGFNASPIHPRRCRVLLTKLAYLLFTGDTFARSESTQLFFSITKLFQHKDIALRQMVYLVIKDLALSADDVIMITSSIMKDIAVASDVVYRPNAIRTLARIIDASTIQAIERLIKNAIVDKNPIVSSAALISSYHLLPVSRDVVRRWANETQDTVLAQKSLPSSAYGGAGGALAGFGGPASSFISQYHALGLLYQLRAHDRMALVKMIQQLSNAGSALKSPAATVMLIRFVSRVLDDDKNLRKPLFSLLESWLKHKSDMVNFEAAKAILEIRDVTDDEVAPAINVLQLFLSSPRFVSRFAAIRILNRFAMTRPQNVNPCNIDIESLINDPNRSIATYAITTLLKTGNEASVDRLMKQITGFLNDISDEFKIIIVDAIRSLCLKFPSKQASMLSFLSGVLRDEGGYEFKRAVVEAMFDLIKFVPESREDALSYLSEFIEDCEFTKLAVRILHLLGTEGPSTARPTKYIRYIYNRVVLENSIVRAAAVTALSKFSLIDDAAVQDSVRVLLTRCLDDPDDEVRDRAALALRLSAADKTVAKEYLDPDAVPSLVALEQQLIRYVTSANEGSADLPFDISSVPAISKDQVDAELLRAKTQATTPLLPSTTVGGADLTGSSGQARSSSSPASSATAGFAGEDLTQRYVAALAKIAEFAPFGSVIRSSLPVALTESETEYVITGVKHLFKQHVVLQYDVQNTLPDTVLEDVSVVATPTPEDGDDEEEEEGRSYVEEFIITIPRLDPETTGTVYVAFTRPSTTAYASTSFASTLRFTSKEIDPSSGEPEDEGYEDEYQVEDLDLGVGDFLVPTYVGNFTHMWDQLSFESSETYALSGINSLQEAINTIVTTLSMQPLEGSDTALQAATHVLKLFARTLTGVKVIAQVRLAYSTKSGVTLKITARSEDELVSKLVVAGVV
ncbi:adaptin N terminal region-domain-containing protein [Lipomyces japonicus]|uniref:adaptin N terminal region-domain-containing protein n=1 Tax=Lipomyces japonicus TaxID=56871 RepID=UPI0034CDC196